MNILVIDVGGTSVKLWHSQHQEHRRFESGKSLVPEDMLERLNATIPDWEYEAIALGMPSRVSNGRIVEDPHNLGPGWIGYNFTAGLGKPTRVMNDACLQALGSFDGGRMLFLGLGTGVGSALVTERLVLSLDLGAIKLQGERASDILGVKGFERLGAAAWQAAVQEFVPMLQQVLMVDYIVLGGGNVLEMETLPNAVRRGHNRTVVEGGIRLWEKLPDPSQASAGDWLVL